MAGGFITPILPNTMSYFSWEGIKMAKTKILRRRKKFSANIPKLRLKKGVSLAKHDPFKSLTNEKLIAQAFWECLKDNDPEGAIEILAVHFQALNKMQLAEDAEMPRSTLYHSLKCKNPTIKTIAKLIHCCA